MLLERAWEIFTVASSLDIAIKMGGDMVRAAFLHFCRVIDKTRFEWMDMLGECIFLNLKMALKEEMGILGQACI